MYKGLSEAIRSLLDRPPEKAVAAMNLLKVVLLTRVPNDIWLVIGEHADYIVVPLKFCSCPHYMISMLTGSMGKPCYHLIAVELARDLRRYIDLSKVLDADTVNAIVIEAIYEGRSRTLRRVLEKHVGEFTATT